MKFAKLATDLWDGLYGKRDFSTMRKELRKYFRDQGMKVRIKNGETLVVDDCITVDFIAFDDYAECKISYGCDADEYTSLEYHNKLFIAALTSNEAYSKGHHTMVSAYENAFYIKSSFYFTRMRMMFDLFFQHYEDVDYAINFMAELINHANEEESQQTTTIGF